MQDYGKFRVIIVDDGSTEPQYREAEKLRDAFSFQCEVIRQENAGAPVATNKGVSHAPEGLIILFDNDIIPSRTCISQHAAFHLKHPDSILSGSADTDITRTVTDVQRYKLHMEETWRKLRPDTEKLLRVDFGNFIITTANMSMQKSVYVQLGGLNPELRDGYDVDFGFRALVKGIPLYFDRNVKTIHNDQISLRYYAGRQKAYDESKKKIAAEHPELREKMQINSSRPSLFKRMAYSILRANIMVRFFESDFFSSTTPRALRYRIYGSTIAALSSAR